MTEFTRILKELLDEQNTTIRSLSPQIGIPYQELYTYVNDDYFPSIYNAEKLANYFDCSFDYLFGLSDTFKTSEFKEVDISKFYPRYLELLQENKISHHHLYKTLGLSKSGLSKWRNGSVPKIESLLKIAKFFGTHIDYLVGRSDIRY